MKVKAPGDVRIVISEQVHSQAVGEETVLLDFGSECYFGLDRVGTRVWQLLAEGRSPAGIVDTLLDEFAVGRDRLTEDVDELLSRLEEAGLIRRSDRATSS